MYTYKGYNISALIYVKVYLWIDLCVGVYKNVMANEIVGFGGLNFFLKYL
jgi:hypothetical protein